MRYEICWVWEEAFCWGREEAESSSKKRTRKVTGNLNLQKILTRRIIKAILPYLKNCFIEQVLGFLVVLRHNWIKLQRGSLTVTINVFQMQVISVQMGMRSQFLENLDRTDIWTFVNLVIFTFKVKQVDIQVPL